MTKSHLDNTFDYDMSKHMCTTKYKNFNNLK